MATDEPEDIAAFRRDARAWIERELPAPPPFKLPQSFLEVESRPQLDYLRDWQRKLFDGGWLGFDVPAEYGGRGRDPARSRVVTQELARARAPFLVNTIGLSWAGPTILAYGTEQQKKRMLGPILSCDEIWCQGFSEPGAGSDLASLRTTATRSESGYSITGHKVWTTLAHFAKWMILLARTDAAVNKYAGLSFFLFPIDVPGIDVQPLVKMTGEGGFNQVVFDGATAPHDCLLGAEGQGWEIAMTTLLFERGAADGGARDPAAPLRELHARVTTLAKERAGGRLDPVVGDRLARLFIEIDALGLATRRARVDELTNERPLAVPMMSKLVASEIVQRTADLACEILGPDVALFLGDPRAPDAAAWPLAYMNSFGFTIGGGTSEILRNLIGERVLSLPKSK